MILLLLCIACNILLAIIFKAFDKYQVNNLNAIIINYVVCVLFATVLLGHSSIPTDMFSKLWWPFSVALSLMFIFGFNILGLSFQKSGVALTAIIQKMSLVMPAAVAIGIYGESFGLLKAMGICLALGAIVLVNLPDKDSPEKLKWRDPVIVYPLITLLISGIIETVLYYVEVEGIVGDDGVYFTAASFGQAAVLGLFASVYLWWRQGISPGVKELIGGLVLGIPNYLCIYLLVYLLSQGWEGSVLFPVQNIGILVLMALTGFLLYGETVSQWKVVGIVLGVMAIVMISWG